MTVKPPQPIFDTLFAFPPNRSTLGGTSYFLKTPVGNGLIDCPAWTDDTQQFLTDQGGVQWFFLTHRTGKGEVRQVQAAFSCTILVQEQEAYLLPGLSLTPFKDEYALDGSITLLWTPGHSPGSSCLYTPAHGGVLFTGRHLLPTTEGNPAPLRVAKTFHWPRQIQHTRRLLDRFSSETLHYICPGANTGFLRGKRVIEDAYERLAKLDLEAALKQSPSL
jgi:glyoxylase-like metal-dependent hydrolase (beta-lactamase superfamily II)